MTIREYLEYLRFERNYSARTIGEYGKDLAAFEAYFKKLDGHLSWESVDSDVIRDWMESMMDKGNIATSINRRLSALRSFYCFALSRGMVGTDPTRRIQGPKKEKALPQFVREADMDMLLADSMWDMADYGDVLARTLVTLLYEAGLRASETVGLDDTNVDFIAKQLKFTGKGGKQRIVPFGAELADTLKGYMAMRDEKIAHATPALLVSKKGSRLTYWQIHYIIEKQLSRVCTLSKRSPHVLRHTFATAMLNHGAELEGLKKLLGHSRLDTTEVYTHTSFEQLRKVYKSAHPRA